MTPSDLPATTRRVERVDLVDPLLPGLHVWRVGNRVGEAPHWDGETQSLLWIDIRAPAVHRLDPARAELTTWALPGVVGAMGPADPGCVVLALKRSLAILDLARGRMTPLQVVDGEPDHNRLNDGKVSPSGRWFVFGSMDDRAADKETSGALYVTGADGGVRRLHAGLTVANGIAFSPSADTLYFSDSAVGRVWQAPWDEAAGSMGAPSSLCSPDEAAGRPDGAAVDLEGHYWSAGVSAGCLNRFASDGRLLQRLAVPCRAPTMPCFGGPDLRDLYLTSLVRPGWSLTSDRVDGDLLCFPSGTRGMPAPRLASIHMTLEATATTALSIRP